MAGLLDAPWWEVPTAAAAEGLRMPGQVCAEEGCGASAGGTAAPACIPGPPPGPPAPGPPAPGPPAPGPLTGASWQWEHRSGFRDYLPEQSARIERAYQRGDPKARLRTGKTGASPMEVFFADMLQYDPASGRSRRVRRLGSGSLLARLRRLALELARSWRTGQPRRQTFQEYRSRQEALAGGAGGGGAGGGGAAQLYSEASCCGRIASTGAFSAAGTALVLLNAAWIGVELDWNTGSSIQDSPVAFQAVEYLFGALFSLELLIRFGAFRLKRDFARDAWFCFDAGLLVLMAAELILLPLVVLLAGGAGGSAVLQNVAVLRMARLLKVVRMTRLLRALPEVTAMLRGLLAAFRTVMLTLLLLLLLLYAFGIIFNTWTQMHGLTLLQPYFGTVPRSMFSLLAHGAFLDGPSVLLGAFIESETLSLLVLFLAFVFLSCFTVLNLLVGVLCEVVAEAHEEEKLRNASSFLRCGLLDILECYDRDNTQTIGKQEFGALMKNPEVNDVLRRYGASAEDLATLADVLFDDVTAASGAGELGFEELLAVVLRLRGARAARVTDVAELRGYLRLHIRRLQAELREGQRELLLGLGPREVTLRLEQGGRATAQRLPGSTRVAELLRRKPPGAGQLLAWGPRGLELGPELTLGELADARTGEVSLRLAPEEPG